MSVVKLADVVMTQLVTRLRADSTLRSLLVGSVTPRWSVYDEVPEGAACPYIQVGDGAIETVDDTFTKQGSMVLATVHVWSQYAGRKEASDIIDRVKDLVHRYALDTSPYTLEWCTVDSSDVIRDPDGITRHGIVTIRVQAREA